MCPSASVGGPLLAVPLTVVSGLGSRAWLSGLPAKVAGDALYTVLLYVLCLVVRPEVSPLPGPSPSRWA